MAGTKQHIVLQTKNLSIGYSSKHEENCIAKDLNITLTKGKLVCLLGRNGIGKSTLLRTLSKTQEKLSGDINIDGEKLLNISSADLSKKMSLVLTERIPESQLSVYELIALGRQPYTNWLGRLSKEDVMRIEQAIELVDIKDICTKKNYELSCGFI